MFLPLPADTEALCLLTGSALPTAAIVVTYQFDSFRSGQDRRERAQLIGLMPTRLTNGLFPVIAA